MEESDFCIEYRVPAKFRYLLNGLYFSGRGFFQKKLSLDGFEKKKEEGKMLKKLLGFALILVCLVALTVTPALATEETCEQKCEKALVECQNACEDEANCKADCDHKNEECLKACKEGS